MIKRPMEVLGIYRLRVTAKMLKRQFDELYGYPMPDSQRRKARLECKKQLQSVVLVEVLVKSWDAKFQIRDFTQEREGVPRSSWQAAWAHVYLAADGESILSVRLGEHPRAETFRSAFFLHFYQPDKTLQTTYGEYNCPPVEEMPDRLARLVPFLPVD